MSEPMPNQPPYRMHYAHPQYQPFLHHQQQPPPAPPPQQLQPLQGGGYAYVTQPGPPPPMAYQAQHDYGGAAAAFSNFSQAFGDVDGGGGGGGGGRGSEEYDYERTASLMSWDPRQPPLQPPPQQPQPQQQQQQLPPPPPSRQQPLQPQPIRAPPPLTILPPQLQPHRQLSGSLSAASLTPGGAAPHPYRTPSSRSGPTPLIRNPASFGAQSYEYPPSRGHHSHSASPAAPVIYEQSVVGLPPPTALGDGEPASSSSGSSLSGSYVAALRKQKATCWTASRQPVDPHKEAARRAAKQKAMNQVVNSGSRGSVLVSDNGDFSLVPENANMIGVAAPTRMLAAFLDGAKLAAEDEKEEEGNRRSSTFLSRNAPKFSLPTRMK